MGPSSSGKDTIKRRLIKENKFTLKEMIMSTTRPMRTGEVEGREYYFKTVEEMLELEKEGKIIERRTYIPLMAFGIILQLVLVLI